MSRIGSDGVAVVGGAAERAEEDGRGSEHGGTSGLVCARVNAAGRGPVGNTAVRGCGTSESGERARS